MHSLTDGRTVYGGIKMYVMSLWHGMYVCATHHCYSARTLSWEEDETE